MRHASFFSGVGGLDLGFEKAGIETVSVCEIDPYASSVLAERFPDAPNLGDIVKLAEKELGGSNGKVEIAGRLQPDDGRHSAFNQISQVGRRSHWDDLSDWRTADIWSGGFPCQDLSTAGKRSGFAGARSSLAFTFLDLVERYRPRWLLLENVPGLFSSNKGADFGRLLYEMEQLRYGVSWRTLDARFFGVAQRRRRVFIVASLESDRAAEVLFECASCERHPAPSRSQGQGATASIADGSGISSPLTARFHKGVNTTLDEPLVIGALVAGLANRTGTTQDELYVGYGERVASSSTNADGVREADGLSGRMDNQPVVDTFGATTHRTLQARDWKVGVSNQDLNHMAANEGFLVGGVSVQGVIQDAREMANKSQNGIGASTEDISYTLTGVDRPAVVTESILSFPSRFGSNANVTEGHAQSIAHSAGAPAVLRIGQSFDGLNQTLESDGAHRTLRVGRDSSDFVVAPAVYRKSSRAQHSEDSETWVDGDVANTLNTFDMGDVRTTHAIVGGTTSDDDLLPVGLDSHRYRCCGNGVVAPVAEWIGRRIVEVDRRWREEGK